MIRRWRSGRTRRSVWSNVRIENLQGRKTSRNERKEFSTDHSRHRANGMRKRHSNFSGNDQRISVRSDLNRRHDSRGGDGRWLNERSTSKRREKANGAFLLVDRSIVTFGEELGVRDRCPSHRLAWPRRDRREKSAIRRDVKDECPTDRSDRE